MSISDQYKLALEINDQVARFLTSRFGTKKASTHKSDSHYGIAEDRQANTMYEEFFKRSTPEVALFTEEGERNLGSEFVWVVDPIEGTSNYKAGNPFWATQVALMQNGNPVVSIVNAPILGQKFTAIKNQKALLNDAPITPTDLEDMSLALVDMCRGTKDADKDWATQTLAKIIKKVRTNRVFGACGLQISYAAAGITDIFVNSGSQIYDVVPGILIAREAGAKVLNLEGKDWELGDQGQIISNEKLARDFLKLINE